MPDYRKKPVVIQAIQYTSEVGGLVDDICAFVGRDLDTVANGGLLIPTLEGDMRADMGDYIIRGIKGEFYPCKPDIFLATYDPV